MCELHRPARNVQRGPGSRGYCPGSQNRAGEGRARPGPVDPASQRRGATEGHGHADSQGRTTEGAVEVAVRATGCCRVRIEELDGLSNHGMVPAGFC